MKLALWDLPTRLFHWSLVISFAFLFYSGETGEWMEWHMNVGIFVLALVLFRLVWGFVGSQTARFSSFMRLHPQTIVDYMKTLPKRDHQQYAGHNPLGGLVVLLMLVLLFIQAVSGLFNSDDILAEGPLYAMVSEAFSDMMGGLHETVFELLLLIVVLHIAAIIFYRLYKGINLVKPMIIGWINWREKPAPSLFFKSAWFGIALLLLISVAVFVIVAWLAAGSGVNYEAW